MPSKFAFLQDHKGLRPGCIHIILGTTGSGKSTLVTSMLEEMLYAKKRVLFYLTEESTKDVETKLSYGFLDFDQDLFGIFTEVDLLKRCDGKKETRGFISQLEMAIDEMKPDILVFDNFTTSSFGDQNKNSPEVALALKQLVQEKNIPLLLVAHTGSSIKDGMFFDSSCVRGFRTITNIAEYVYCYLRLREEVMGEGRTANFIFTDKSRNHSEASRSTYKLFFDGTKKIFTSDQKASYGDLKKLIKR